MNLRGITVAAGTVAALLVAGPAPAQTAAAGETVLIIDTPSGINRFVRAANAWRAEEERAGGTPTRWILRTTRQVDAAGPDSLRAWLASADRAVVRLAVGDVARSIGSALEAAPQRPGRVWIYQSDPGLVRHSRDGADRFLHGRDEAWLRAAQEPGGGLDAGEPASVRAWHLGSRYLNARGVDNARALLRFMREAERVGADRALAAAPPLAPADVPERYPLPDEPALPASAPSVGILDFDSYALNSEAEIIDSVAAVLRRRGIRPVAVVARWGEPTVAAMRRHFLHPDGSPAVDAVISLQSFVLGGDAARTAADSLLTVLDVPLFRAIRLTDVDPDEWAGSTEGIPWAAAYHQVAMPEVQGAIEPTVVAAEATAAVDPLTGARRAIYQPITAQLELLAGRVERWVALRRTPAADKRVALIYYNHPPGKQNIGADNLNVTGSIVRLLELLHGAGYQVGEASHAAWARDADSLASRLVRQGINTGVFGAGQLQELAGSGAVLLPAETYAAWFARLPRLVRREVEDGPLGYLEALLEDHRSMLASLPPNLDPEDAARARRAHDRLVAEMDLVFGQMRDFFAAFEYGGPERTRGPALLADTEQAARAALGGTGTLEQFGVAKRRFLALGIEALSGWGPPPGRVMAVERGGRAYLVIPGVRAGNVFLGPQPQRGFHADPEKVHASTLVSPPHHYLAFYAYLAHEFGADALVHIGRHSSYEWLPRKQVGLSAADHPVAILHGLPSVYLYTVDGVGEGLQAKRRGLATIVDHLTPPIKTTEVYGELLDLQGMHDSFHAQKSPERRREIASRIRERLREDRLTDLREEIEAEAGGVPVGEMDDDLLVHEVGHELGHFRETMMPFGLHTYATGWTEEEERMLARSMIGMQVDTTGAEGRLRADSAEVAIVALLRQSVRAEASAFLRALDGRRIEPGPGNDPIRTPAALPTGRNFHALDASLVPTRLAVDLGATLAERSLDALRRERADPAYTPERVSAVLWATETVRDEGAMVGFTLALLGIAPEWDARGQIRRLHRVPADSLQRPRIDVTLVTSGLFRDLFAPALHRLDEAFRLALAGSARVLVAERPELRPALNGALRDLPESAWGSEPLSLNPVARHWAEEAAERLAADPGARGDSAAAARLGRRSLERIFGPAPGNYGAGVSYLVGQPGTWRERAEVADHYLERMQYAYGAESWGRPGDGTGLARKLRGVEASFHSRSTNLYGIADNDDFFDYFGGLSMAAERVNGRVPSNIILHSANPRQVEAERLQTFLGRELRARYYNPEWIRGQMGEGYDGARTISNKFVEFLWGWQVTNPDVVRDWMWDEIQDVYLHDRHGLGVDAWLADGDRNFAMQNVAAILLTAAQRGFWDAEPARLRALSNQLATLVAEHGAACSSHICGNPDAMAFAEARMDAAHRERFRDALHLARGGEARAYASALRRTRADREPLATAMPVPVLPPEPSGTRAAPAVAAATPDDATGEVPLPDEAPTTVLREVRLRAGELAASPWGWAGAFALLVLIAAFGIGLARARGATYNG